MKPINSQIFYYVLLVYAVGMVAYIALPTNSSVVVADTASSAKPATAAPVVHNSGGTVEVIAHPVSMDQSRAQQVPFVTTPDDDSLQTPASLSDGPKSL